MADDALTLVTGGTSGIGRATARALAEAGHRVMITSRDAERARQTAAAVAQGARTGVEGRPLDLLSPASTQAFARQLLDEGRGIRALVHNAGAVFPDRRLSEDGFEAQLRVTYVGPFGLTQQLWPLLTQRPDDRPARVVNVASDLHRQATLQLDDVNFERRRYGFVRAFAQAELMKIMWTYELARRASPHGVTVNCLHPGGVRTSLFRELRGPAAWMFALSNLLKRGPEAGARTSVFVADDPSLDDVTGRYFVGRRARRSHARTYDEADAARLWDWTVAALKLPPWLPMSGQHRGGALASV